ncbi:PREDICTED: uncharacterized protein LOC108776354 [Cyphomyrmex costatus]|uniref:uncharacterized protein LOC108776354 n=1 Tax=Cyphomyrmex costatus TaxID=456900 RepID=UPI000852387B|nr:PREDICTED: uncharacterized protein LOC108776354 [Cyphomyrmex costatus]
MSTVHQLTGIGFQINQEWLGTVLLAGLPEHFQPMIMALESSGMMITGDSVKVKLLQESNCCNGHMANECSDKKKDDKENKEDYTEGSSTKTAFLTGAFLSKYQESKDTDWILDSGASVHMTPNREFFDSFTEFDGMEIAMADI